MTLGALTHTQNNNLDDHGIFKLSQTAPCLLFAHYLFGSDNSFLRYTVSKHSFQTLYVEMFCVPLCVGDAILYCWCVRWPRNSPMPAAASFLAPASNPMWIRCSHIQTQKTPYSFLPLWEETTRFYTRFIPFRNMFGFVGKFISSFHLVCVLLLILIIALFLILSFLSSAIRPPSSSRSRTRPEHSFFNLLPYNCCNQNLMSLTAATSCHSRLFVQVMLQ